MNTWVRDNEPADVRSLHVYYTIWWDVLRQFIRFLEGFKDSNWLAVRYKSVMSYKMVFRAHFVTGWQLLGSCEEVSLCLLFSGESNCENCVQNSVKWARNCGKWVMSCVKWDWNSFNGLWKFQLMDEYLISIFCTGYTMELCENHATQFIALSRNKNWGVYVTLDDTRRFKREL